jgi:hypothetical protein
MIVTLHVATGALAGAAARSRLAALLLPTARSILTLGAVSASAPDLEHILPLPRPGGRPLFPSHRWARLHQGGTFPAWAQLLIAGALLVALCRSERGAACRRRDDRRCTSQGAGSRLREGGWG